MTDVTVRNEGSIVLFNVDTPAAQDWWNEHVDPACLTYGGAYVVEHRYAPPIINHMIEDELEVEVN